MQPPALDHSVAAALSDNIRRRHASGCGTPRTTPARASATAPWRYARRRNGGWGCGIPASACGNARMPGPASAL